MTVASRRQRPERRRIFCHMDNFPEGWNEDEGGEASIISQVENKVLAMSWFGSIKLDLNDRDSVQKCINETRQFADNLQKVLNDYLADRGELVADE